MSDIRETEQNMGASSADAADRVTEASPRAPAGLGPDGSVPTDAWTERWKFERMESAEEFAKLKGETLAEHEGYYRDNNGDWIVTFADPDDEIGGRVAAVTFKGKAKRGETYRAPDPIGMARARLIAAAPELYSALTDCVKRLRSCATHAGNAPFAVDALCDQFEAPLRKARGEAA